MENEKLKIEPTLESPEAQELFISKTANKVAAKVIAELEIKLVENKGTIEFLGILAAASLIGNVILIFLI